ncbi:hypothetical protein [Gloeocapsa sp. PCC 73106]|uniref:hypothetical protein n=1 Tax=Gloeocapsa sp. PCC 73106 TaxID=102232 RepID=UPI0002AC47F5|nr:hypothetical protein [Gloeocapsa sp. PCC 73106]ELR99476.1 hypothetical protein GLO73106DRAFT_00033280 [Gloeocapsa sp. PCC 73106]
MALIFNLFLRELLSQPRDVLVLRFTALLLLLYGSSTVVLDVPLSILSGLMLLSPVFLTSQVLWVIICALLWWINATDWLWIDNHKILITYWGLVCALAVSAKDADEVLAWNGRLLIGLTFLFATIWKVLAGEYWDGSFLHYTFMLDPRVESVAMFIGGLSRETLVQNRLLEVSLQEFPKKIGQITLFTSTRLQWFALAASYWTLLIEASVAIAFLLPSFFSRYRDWLLIVFIATTYFLLPVLGFAYVLMIMGFAQCHPQNTGIRVTYICLFAFLQLARLF